MKITVVQKHEIRKAKERGMKIHKESLQNGSSTYKMVVIPKMAYSNDFEVTRSEQDAD